MQNILSNSFDGWNFCENYDVAQNGRIWILWRHALKVSIIVKTEQSITAAIEFNSNIFYISAIYSSNDGRERTRLWEHLVSLNNTFQDKAWMLAGDFNVTLNPDESSTYDGSQGVTMDMKEFRDCTSQISVFDHCFSGNYYTWTNKHQVDFLARKLDIVLINRNWDFTTTVEFMALEVSDHSPAIIKVADKRRELEAVQNQLLSKSALSSRSELANKEKVLGVELQQLVEAEERFYKTKIKNYIDKGRRLEYRFFHKSVNVRKNQNIIQYLTYVAGVILDTFD
ncbi:hypothetical protein DITRI_Ditri17bG0066100 [Diplodiscus trichospermus]